MGFYLGSTHLFNKPEEELPTSTGTNRLLTLNGVQSLSDLDNRLLFILSKSIGNANATLTINSLDAKPIKCYSGSDLVNVSDNWITFGQLYLIIYSSSNDCFIMYNYIHQVIENDVLLVNSNILSLTNSSSAEDISTAFGDADNVISFIDAIESNKVILFVDYDNVKTIIPITYSSTTSDTITTDSITILNVTNKTLDTYNFKRANLATTYDSVEVLNTSLTNA